MKKLFSVLTALMLLLALSSCSSAPKTALTIEDTEINEEIYAYFLDKIISNPAAYSLSENAGEKELCAAATKECKTYLATNTAFRDLGLSLTSAKKAEISATVNNLWVRSENYYKSIGVSKQTLTKAQTAQAYEDAIFTAKYDKGFADASAETEIKNYFYSNYISFRTVCVYFTKADGVTPMTQAEKNELLAKFELLGSGETTADAFTQAILDIGYTASDSVILKKGSDGYPEGFYEKVAAMADSETITITYDDCVFAVFKENLEEKGEGVYANYRSVCISDLYSGEYEDYIEEYIADFKTDENKSVISDIFKRLK